MVGVVYVNPELAEVNRNVAGVGQNSTGDLDGFLVRFSPLLSLSPSPPPLHPLSY